MPLSLPTLLYFTLLYVLTSLQALPTAKFTLRFLVPNLCSESHNPLFLNVFGPVNHYSFSPYFILLSLFDLGYILPTPVLLLPAFYSNAPLWLIQSHRVICALSVLSSGSSPHAAALTSTTYRQIFEITLFIVSNPCISFYIQPYGLLFTALRRILERS